MTRKSKALDLVAKNIAEHGYHLYAISGDAVPRFVYTIGNLDSFNVELILAGASFHSLEEAICVIHEAVGALMDQKTVSDGNYFASSFGTFGLRPLHKTWIDELMLGATDYYDGRSVSALQLVPDQAHYTIDTPDMTQAYSPNASPVWRWLRDPWPYAVPKDSVAMTNLAALRGEPITEAARWEESDWELFSGAGPDVKREEVRAVGLGPLLGFDPSLEPIAKLAVGKALWREDKGAPWQAWEE